AGQQAYVGGERAGLDVYDRTLAVLSRQDDLERSPEDDVESRVLRALLEEHLAPAHRSAGPQVCEAVDLLVRELGKHLPTALVEGILQHGQRYWPASAGNASRSPAEASYDRLPSPAALRRSSTRSVRSHVK